ncbi:MAG: branched-chain amino acid ABC transporter permease [Candidatus Bipolaricaulota bacterium]|nr:branched-chain amino acid ABC transporter permease [Candidatus Bipolaricaulota bacterium]
MELTRLIVSVTFGVLGGWLFSFFGRSLFVRLGLAILGALLLGATIVLAPREWVAYLLAPAITACLYAVLALGLNIQWGLTGLFNIGIAAFFAVGAFTSALITKPMPTGLAAEYTKQLFGWNLPFIYGVLGAALVCGVIALLIGLLTLRLREDYLAIATIGIAESLRLVFQNERWLANGPQPLSGIPKPLFCLVEDPPCVWLPSFIRELLAPLDSRDYGVMLLVLLALSLMGLFWLLQMVTRSPWGRVLRAIREDEAATSAFGKNVFAFKIQAFVLGACVMGIGGALFTASVSTIDFGLFHPMSYTFMIWVMLMAGGSGNHKGAVFGAFAIWAIWVGTTFLSDAVVPFQFKTQVFYVRYLLVGVLLIAILLFRPQGILPEEKGQQ